jgi:hypothetical protein
MVRAGWDAALAAPAVAETGALTDCLRKNLRIFIEELESLTGSVGVRAIAKRLRAELAAQAPKAAETGKVEEILCEMEAFSDPTPPQPGHVRATAACRMNVGDYASRLRTALAAQAPQVAEPGALQELIGLWRDEDCKHTWAKKHANNDEPAELICANELSAALAAQAPKPSSESLSRCGHCGGLFPRVFDHIEECCKSRPLPPYSPLHMHDEDMDAAERDAMLADDPASLSTGRLEGLIALIPKPDEYFYIEHRGSGRNYRGEELRFIVDRRGKPHDGKSAYDNEDANEWLRKLTLALEAALKEQPAPAKEKQS